MRRSTVDYYPDFDFEEFRLNTCAGWECLLDSDTGLNMKIAAWDRYNGSRSAGDKRNDVLYMLMLGCLF